MADLIKTKVCKTKSVTNRLNHCTFFTCIILWRTHAHQTMQACSALAASARGHELCFVNEHSVYPKLELQHDVTYLCKLMWMMKLAVHDVSKQHEDHEGNAEAVAAHGTLPLLQKHNMCCWKRGKVEGGKRKKGKNWWDFWLFYWRTATLATLKHAHNPKGLSSDACHTCLMLHTWSLCQIIGTYVVLASGSWVKGCRSNKLV